MKEVVIIIILIALLLQPILIGIWGRRDKDGNW